MSVITVNDLKKKLGDSNYVFIDNREAIEFVDGFVPGSILVKDVAGFVKSYHSHYPGVEEFIVVSDNGAEEEQESSKISYLEGGIENWLNSSNNKDMIIVVEADELAMDLPHDEHLIVLDVRPELIFAQEHIVGSTNIPISEMIDPASLALLEEESNIYILGADLFEAAQAASLIKREGLHNLRVLEGGWKAIKEEKRIPLEKNPEKLN
jgi:hydroxyacylglutathione hydrolase